MATTALGMPRTGIWPSTERIDRPYCMYSYRGVLRDGPRVIWTCIHEHPHRDIGPQAAMRCSGSEWHRRKEAGEDLSGEWRPRARKPPVFAPLPQDAELPF